MKTITKISRWGNSLAIRIPSAVSKQLNLHDNSTISIQTKNDYIIFKRIEEPDKLSELVSKITPVNRPDCTDWGEAQGNEIW